MPNIPTVREKNSVGRPPKIDDKMIERVVEALLKCHTQKSAAISAGISEKTFYNYLERARTIIAEVQEDPARAITEADWLYLKFLAKIEEAESEVEDRLLDRIDDAGLVRWQANAWILERRFGDRWAQKTSVRHEGDAGRPITFTLKIPGMNAPALKDGLIEEEILDAEFTEED